MEDLLKRLGFDPSRGVPDEVDEHLYALAAQELSSGETRPGLMAKAFSDAEGDERRAEALYLRLRVVQLRREYETAIRTVEAQRVNQLTASEHAVAARPTKPEQERISREFQGNNDRFVGVVIVVFATIAAALLLAVALP